MIWPWYQYLLPLLPVAVLAEYAVVWWMASGGLAARRRRLGTEKDFIPGHMALLGWVESKLERLPPRWRPADNPLPRLRHPLALAGIALRRLGKNRWLAALVVGIVVTSIVVFREWIRPGYYGDLPYPDPGDLQLPWFSFDWAGLSVAVDWLLSGLESLAVTNVPGWPLLGVFALSPVRLLLLAVFAGVMVGLACRRPRWLAPGLRRRLLWPGLIMLVGALAGPLLRFEHGSVQWLGDRLGGVWSEAAYALPPRLFALVAVAAAVAVEWSLVWQVARGARWSLREAVRDLARHWPAALLLWLAAAGVETAFRFPALGFVALVVWQLLPAVTFFLPLIIIAERLPLVTALQVWWGVRRSYWRDLVVFMVRFAAVAVVGRSVVEAVRMVLGGGLVSQYLAEALVEAYVLLLAVVVAVWYVELRRADRAEGALRAGGVTPEGE